MAKFGVGDKVRILDGEGIPCYTGGWTKNMAHHVGEVHTIEVVDDEWPVMSDGEKCIRNRISYEMESMVYDFDERGLELVESAKEKSEGTCPEEKREKGFNESVTITKDEFCELSAGVLHKSKAMSELVEHEPVLVLAFAMYSAEIADAIFRKK